MGALESYRTKNAIKKNFALVTCLELNTATYTLMNTFPILGVVSPDPNDALSLWRAMGPFTHPSFKNHVKVRAFYPGSFGWADAASCDAVFFHRPFLKCHLEAMMTCVSMNIPTWCDWDDDLFQVPEGNPAHGTYAIKEVRNRIALMAQLANYCTFSTYRLREEFVRRADLGWFKTGVIKNAVDERMFPYQPLEMNEDGPLLWRGTVSHARDLDRFRSLIEALQRDFPIHYVGYKPWWAEGIHHPSRDPKSYFNLLQDIAPKCIFVPLDDCPFNRSKSDIALLEATAVGAVCVTNMPWAGALSASDALNFESLVRGVMSSKKHDMFYVARTVFSRRQLRHENASRLKVLKQLNILS